MESNEKQAQATGKGGQRKQIRGVALSPNEFKVDSNGNLVVNKAAIDQIAKSAASPDALKQATEGAVAIRITIGIDF